MWNWTKTPQEDRFSMRTWWTPSLSWLKNKCPQAMRTRAVWFDLISAKFTVANIANGAQHFVAFGVSVQIGHCTTRAHALCVIGLYTDAADVFYTLIPKFRNYSNWLVGQTCPNPISRAGGWFGGNRFTKKVEYGVGFMEQSTSSVKAHATSSMLPLILSDHRFHLFDVWDRFASAHNRSKNTASICIVHWWTELTRS